MRRSLGESVLLTSESECGNEAIIILSDKHMRHRNDDGTLATFAQCGFETGKRYVLVPFEAWVAFLGAAHFCLGTEHVPLAQVVKELEEAGFTGKHGSVSIKIGPKVED